MTRHHEVAGETAVLGIGASVAGVLAALCTLVPFSPTAPRTLCAVLAVVGLTVGSLLRHSRGRVPVWLRHGVLATATVAITAAVASSTTAAGPGVTAYGFLWVVIHSAVFHERRPLLRHLAGVAVGLAVGLTASGAPSPVQTWVFVMATAGAIALVLGSTVARLSTEATEDPLTRTATRRAFLRAAQRVLARAARRDEPVTLVLVDLDHFKRVNDEGGHDAGDALLESVSRAWRTALRRDDVLGRIGGDEFAVLLPGADEATARAVVRRMHELSPTSWSAGLAVWTGESLDEWLRRADDDLYAAKADRRP